MLRKIDLASYTIEQTSEYLLSLRMDGVSSQDLATQITDVWARFLLQSNREKKIALIYLANDLI